MTSFDAAAFAFFNEQSWSASMSRLVLKGALMPGALESLLWCAALATWLMLFFGIAIERVKPLSKFLGHLLEVAFKLKAK